MRCKSNASKQTGYFKFTISTRERNLEINISVKQIPTCQNTSWKWTHIFICWFYVKWRARVLEPNEVWRVSTFVASCHMMPQPWTTQSHLLKQLLGIMWKAAYSEFLTFQLGILSLLTQPTWKVFLSWQFMYHLHLSGTWYFGGKWCHKWFHLIG